MSALIEDWYPRPAQRYREDPAMRVVTRECACGKRIRADRLVPGPYVYQHNRSKPHREWRERMGL